MSSPLLALQRSPGVCLVWPPWFRFRTSCCRSDNIPASQKFSGSNSLAAQMQNLLPKHRMCAQLARQLGVPSASSQVWELKEGGEISEYEAGAAAGSNESVGCWVAGLLSPSTPQT